MFTRYPVMRPPSMDTFCSLTHAPRTLAGRVQKRYLLEKAAMQLHTPSPSDW